MWVWGGECTEIQHMIAPSSHAHDTMCKTEERKGLSRRVKRKHSKALLEKVYQTTGSVREAVLP